MTEKFLKEKNKNKHIQSVRSETILQKIFKKCGLGFEWKYWQIDGFHLKTRNFNVKVSAGKGKAVIGVEDTYAENCQKCRKTNSDLDEYFPGN